MEKMKKEIRLAEIRSLQNDNNEMILEGYAATFEQPTTICSFEGIDYKEVIARGAFDGTIMKDCCLKYNHMDSVPILARTRGGSLSLTVDDKGLFFRAKLFDTQSAKDVYTLVKAGGLDKCSFAFTIAENNGDEYDKTTHTRIIKKIDKLYDCSIVDIPAYDSTTVQARSFFEAEAEKERKALESAELRRKLLLKTYL